jgi:hypothetical protein
MAITPSMRNRLKRGKGIWWQRRRGIGGGMCNEFRLYTWTTGRRASISPRIIPTSLVTARLGRWLYMPSLELPVSSQLVRSHSATCMRVPFVVGGCRVVVGRGDSATDAFVAAEGSCRAARALCGDDRPRLARPQCLRHPRTAAGGAAYTTSAPAAGARAAASGPSLAACRRRSTRVSYVDECSPTLCVNVAHMFRAGNVRDESFYVNYLSVSRAGELFVANSEASSTCPGLPVDLGEILESYTLFRGVRRIHRLH